MTVIFGNMEFTGDLKKAVTVPWWKLLCPATGFQKGRPL